VGVAGIRALAPLEGLDPFGPVAGIAHGLLEPPHLLALLDREDRLALTPVRSHISRPCALEGSADVQVAVFARHAGHLHPNPLHRRSSSPFVVRTVRVRSSPGRSSGTTPGAHRSRPPGSAPLPAARGPAGR